MAAIKAVFIRGYVFLNSNPSTTLTEPGAAERVISVGAYNHITDASYVASGRGYTATGLIKPDFVAPGVDVYGVRAGGDIRHGQEQALQQPTRQVLLPFF